VRDGSLSSRIEDAASGGGASARLGPDLHRRVQYVLAAGYLAMALLGLVWPWQPRVFWTMLLPLLPLAIVLMGFSSWRRICPIAFFGEAGRALDRRLRLARAGGSGGSGVSLGDSRGPGATLGGSSRGGRHVPAWLERWFLPFTFALLLAMLVLRLVATNGDGRWLGGLLIGLAVAAVAANAIWSGKTWCNFFCPVGLVERIYTEPGSLHAPARTLTGVGGGAGDVLAQANSQCAQCTACKRHCPDIDQENAYWKDVAGAGRRLAFYAFPGLVLAFYVYYWLRDGDWEAYFDGRWTRLPATAELAFGPGFFFAPDVPAVVAATLTLLAFSASSFALFAGIEALAARFLSDRERRRHLMLAVAAFAAWNLFYVFAGAPTLRRLPYGTRSAAFVAPLVGTLVLAKRWRRTRERYIAEQGATRLLRNWEFDEAPPRDAGEVYGWIKASRHAREKDLAAYANTVRDMIADGLVGPGELRLLEGVRRQLGISEREHERILARLSEEERHLFEPGAEVSVESRAQLRGFEQALAEALLRSAPQSEIDELRAVFGVSPADCAAALERLRGAGGPLIERARRQLGRARELGRAFQVIGGTEPTAARVFLCSLLAKARDEALDRVLELLEIAGDGPMIQALRRRLFSSTAGERAMALELLAAACPGAESLVGDLEPLLARRPLAASAGEAGGEDEALLKLLASSDPYLRAAAVWAAAREDTAPALGEAVQRADDDEHPLVRETAARFGSVAERAASARVRPGLPAHLTTIETMHLLHAVPLFSGLDPEDLHELALYAIEETIAPPRAIFEEGDADSDALFVILAGRAVVERGSGTGTADTLGRGAVVGELSVLDGSRRDATVRPDGGPVRVLRIPGASFRGGLLRRTRVTEWLLGTLAGRIRRLDAASGRDRSGRHPPS
jgi:Cyclic nucleotide-binding domain